MEAQNVIKELNIIHFNDSYNIEERSREPCGGLARFVTAVKSFSNRDPLVLFSGDLFSPSNCKPYEQMK